MSITNNTDTLCRRPSKYDLPTALGHTQQRREPITDSSLLCSSSSTETSKTD